MVHECLLKLEPFDVLLVFNLLLDVLVALEDLVVFNFPLLQPLVHSELQSLFVGSHLVGLLLHQLRLGSQDLLVSCLFVESRFLFFKIMDSALDLMSFLIVLLFSKICLDSLQIK